jgi:polyhydroxyalkanoate synthesis regulator phasin
MQQAATQHPTDDELSQFAISKFKGIDVGLGQADPMTGVAKKLEQKHPDHLILIQAGKFLHGFDRTAHALSTLKGYQLKLIGTTDEPHLRVGFPAGNFKSRLWSLVDQFGIPYVVALGTLAGGHTVYVSEQSGQQSNVLAAVTPEIVAQVIEDLRQRGNLNKAAAKQVLANPDSSGFKLKQQAQTLDTQLLQDIIKMPRELRVTYGENLRACMARLMRGVFAFGLDVNRAAALQAISADVDLLKHYLAQAPRLSKLKFAFEHRVGLAVELGRLVGGLIRADKVAP